MSGNTCPKHGEKYVKGGFLFRVDDVRPGDEDDQLNVYVVRWPVEGAVTIGRQMFVDISVWEREMFDAVRVVEDK